MENKIAEQYVLPTWIDCSHKCDRDDKQLDPIERFVYDYEPADSDEKFRHAFLNAMLFLASLRSKELIEGFAAYLVSPGLSATDAKAEFPHQFNSKLLIVEGIVSALSGEAAKEKDEKLTIDKSKFAGSEIGSHHWAATVLSYIMRVGEYLNDHGRSTDKDEMNYRGWGQGLHERAIEVNDFLQSLPEMIQNELKEKGNFLEAYNRECQRVDYLVDEVSKKNLHIQKLEGLLRERDEYIASLHKANSKI